MVLLKNSNSTHVTRWILMTTLGLNSFTLVFINTLVCLCMMPLWYQNYAFNLLTTCTVFILHRVTRVTLLWYRPHCFCCVNQIVRLMLTRCIFKSWEVCIKARSPPALLPFKGQVTKQRTVKINGRSIVNIYESWPPDKHPH